MSKFQPPILNDDVCRAAIDKQTHKQTYNTKNIHTEEKHRKPFLPPVYQFFIFYFSFCNSLKVLKRRFPKRENKK